MKLEKEVRTNLKEGGHDSPPWGCVTLRGNTAAINERGKKEGEGEKYPVVRSTICTLINYKFAPIDYHV